MQAQCEVDPVAFNVRCRRGVTIQDEIRRFWMSECTDRGVILTKPRFISFFFRKNHVNYDPLAEAAQF